MSFEPRKYPEITEEMEKRVSGLTDFEVGSVTRTLVETFSYELALMYEKMRLVYLSAFIDTAEGGNLDKVVSILGIVRGLPDFSTGMATFERDKGNNEIVIPLGTLVATQDAPGKPKKVYQTIEEKTLAGNATAIEIKIQAIERGEEQDAKAGDIVVMPRPLPGIKGVLNRADVRLTGKVREQDGELRERSKNALISAGKATILSIENTLLSQSGVFDVKVREDFLLPQGEGTFSRKSGVTQDITIPRYSQIKATISGQTILLRTKSEVFLKTGHNDGRTLLQSEIEGKKGELETLPNGTVWQFVKPELEALVTLSHLKPVLLSDFGVIDVFVDGPDLGLAEEKARISTAIDRVKAAGVYVRLEGTSPVYFDGIFRIDADLRQYLSQDELDDLEYRVSAAIRYFLNQTKMGETLLFSKLMREVLSVEGVENLADFEIFTEAIRYGGLRKPYVLGDIKIENEESERFKARDICVAATDKALPVDIELEVSNLSEESFDTLHTNFNKYTDGLEKGKPLMVLDLLTQLEAGVSGIKDESLKLKPRPWMQRSHLLLFDKKKNITGVNVSFVEKATSGVFFAHSSFIEITGAVTITLDANTPSAKAKSLQSTARAAVENYLENLGPEQDVDLDALAENVRNIEGINNALWNSHDFVIEKRVGTTLTTEPNRMNGNIIGVEPFEKTRLPEKGFCIAFRTEQVNIEVTEVTLRLQSPVTDPQKREELQTLTSNILNNFLQGTQPGNNVDFVALRTAIENRLPAAPAIVETLTIKAVSEADGREQNVSISNPMPIHIRTVELPRMKTVLQTDVKLLSPDE
jgi:uncharacterized phage protein gp47/JayE